LSRGLVLVKWWLLAIPHYLVIGVFVGGAWAGAGIDRLYGGGGLVGLLVVFAGVVLLFTSRYPKPLYDFVLGMNRWAFRVAAYATLMTDVYPPFRLDMGNGASVGQRRRLDPADANADDGMTAELAGGERRHRLG